MDTRTRDHEGKKWRNLWGKSLGRTRKSSHPTPVSPPPPAPAGKSSVPRPSVPPRPLPLRPRRGQPQGLVPKEALPPKSASTPDSSRPQSETAQTTSSDASCTSRTSRKTIQDEDPEWDELRPAIPVHAGQRVDTLWPEPGMGLQSGAGPPAPIILSVPTLSHPAPIALIPEFHFDGAPKEHDVFSADGHAHALRDARPPSNLDARPPSRAEAQPASRPVSQAFLGTDAWVSPRTKACPPPRTEPISSSLRELRAEWRAKRRSESRAPSPAEELIPSQPEAWAPPWAAARPSSRSELRPHSRGELRPLSRTEVQGMALAAARPASRTEVRTLSCAERPVSSRTEMRPSSRAVAQASSPACREPSHTVSIHGCGVLSSEKPGDATQHLKAGAVPDRYAIRDEAALGRSIVDVDLHADLHLIPPRRTSSGRMEGLASLKQSLESSRRLSRGERTETEKSRSRPSSREESIDSSTHFLIDVLRPSKDKKRPGDVPWPRSDHLFEREKEERRPPRERKNPPASLSSGAAHASIIMTSPPKPEPRVRRSSGSSPSQKKSEERPRARWARSHSLGESSSPSLAFILNETSERTHKGSSASTQTPPVVRTVSPALAVTGAPITAPGVSSTPSRDPAEQGLSPLVLPSEDASGEASFLPATVAPTHFHRIRLLGQGDVGRVYLVRDKYSGTVYAMKVLNKKDLVRRDKVRRALMEQQILLHTRHPFIIRLHHTFQSADFLFFCLDYACGGELFSALRKYDPPVLSEKSARFYAAEVVLALGYLHTRGVVYRDLKPENLLLTQGGHLLLADFDLSARAPSGDLTGFRTNSLVGTMVYLAPEVIRGDGHTTGVDWWTLGILIYEMVHAAVPFEGETQDDTFDMILESDVQFPTPPLMGRRGTSFVQELLAKDETTRLGAKGTVSVQAHPWFRGLEWDRLQFLDPPLHPLVPDLEGGEQPEQPGGRPVVCQDQPSAEDPFATFASVSLDAV